MLAVGAGKLDEDGNRIPLDVNEGDEVVYPSAPAWPGCSTSLRRIYAVLVRVSPETIGTRRASIPTVRDRVVQAAVKLVIEPVFEADFLLQVLLDESWRASAWGAIVKSCGWLPDEVC